MFVVSSLNCRHYMIWKIISLCFNIYKSIPNNLQTCSSCYLLLCLQSCDQRPVLVVVVVRDVVDAS